MKLAYNEEADAGVAIFCQLQIQMKHSIHPLARILIMALVVIATAVHSGAEEPPTHKTLSTKS